MTPAPKHEGCQLANCPDFVPRPELEALVESLRRELSGYAKGQAEILSRIDALLAGNKDDARAFGGLQADVRRLGDDVSKLQNELRDVRERADEPRDGIVKLAIDLAKLGIAALVGYFVSRGVH